MPSCRQVLGPISSPFLLTKFYEPSTESSAPAEEHQVQVSESMCCVPLPWCTPRRKRQFIPVGFIASWEHQDLCTVSERRDVPMFGGWEYPLEHLKAPLSFHWWQDSLYKKYMVLYLVDWIPLTLLYSSFLFVPSLPLFTSSLGQVPKMLVQQYLSYQLKLSNWLPPLSFQRAL